MSLLSWPDANFSLCSSFRGILSFWSHFGERPCVLVFQFSCKLNHFPTPSFLGYGSEELVFGEMTWLF